MSRSRDVLLAQRLSEARLSSYLRVSGGDLGSALELYEWNAAVSSAFFEVLADLEVVIRNAFHHEFDAWVQRRGFTSSWLENQHGILLPNAVKDISDARERLLRKKKQVTPDQIVSELNFGFWRFLLAKHYRTTVWPFVGQFAFPNLESRMVSDFSQRVARLHTLRNRIAHHEPIHNRILAQDLDDCFVVVGAVCTTTANWVRGRSRVLPLLDARSMI
jgi:hypothetical protein